MNNKKKIIAICVCVALLAGTILSGTIAYFTDDEAITNTFTSGNVFIDLEEYSKDGLVDFEDAERPFNNQKLFPEDEIIKKPVITVGKTPLGDNATSEDAYVAAIITVTAKDLSTVGAGKTSVVDADTDLLIPEPLIQSKTEGILNDAEECDNKAKILAALADGKNAVLQTVKTVGEDTVYTFYLFVNEAKSDDESVTLFDTLSIPYDWDNDEMNLLKGLSIDVKAYAVQTNHLDNCHDAMVSAFGTEFAEANA